MSESSATFEQGMRRLEEIVQELERGDVPLEDTLRLFKEGIEIRERCGALLEKAETELKVLVARAGADGARSDVITTTNGGAEEDDLPFE